MIPVAGGSLHTSAIARRPVAGQLCAGGVHLHVSPWVRPMSRGRITMASTLARMARCRKPNQYANSAKSHFRVKKNGRSCEGKTLPDKSVHLDRENRREALPHANSVPFAGTFRKAEH
ncbi:hypothetical protein [Stenotrophomonas cyclobalanopsidis]|uniref:hypothetical protein n=1 Tax=Stenotrophomonas cyclobalanopsidis TaxID=2771362 RepID=UPI0028AEB712|nr:hypothetical protein [Stenotrophomonas cyclobalanopsidis]